MPRRLPPYALLTALAVTAAAACNLPGLPGVRDGGPVRDAGADTTPPADTSTPPPRPDVPSVCRADGRSDGGDGTWRQCWGSGVMTCVDNGTNIEFTPCGDHELCQDGECQPVENQCDTSLPFRLSKSSLAFDSNGRLRSDSDSVVVENCSDFDLLLHRADIQYRRTDLFPTGLSPFATANRFPLEEVRIPPGEDLRVRVEYAPQFGYFTHKEPRLLLDVRAAQPYVTELPMERRIHCVSTAPDVALGEWQRGERTNVEIPVYNCGTVAARVTRPELDDVPADGMALTGPDKSKVTREIPPGETADFPIGIEATRAGTVSIDVPLFSRRADATQSQRVETITTRLGGRVVTEQCAEPAESGGVWSPEYRSAEADTWSSGPEATVAPGREFHIRTPATGNRPSDHRFYLSQRPDRSQRSLRPAPHSDDRYVRLTPDVPGTYVIAHDPVDADQGPSCEPQTFRLEVRPEAPVYVELDWAAVDDPIPFDHGYGRGVDLDLHVKASRDDAPGAWMNSNSDCFERGEEAGGYCFDTQSIRSVSVSGGGVEAIALDRLDGSTFEIAVQAWNTYRFPGARAEVRVYSDGELREGFPVSTRFGRANGTVWHVGRLDPEADEFTTVDRVQKEFER